MYSITKLLSSNIVDSESSKYIKVCTEGIDADNSEITVELTVELYKDTGIVMVDKYKIGRKHESGSIIIANVDVNTARNYIKNYTLRYINSITTESDNHYKIDYILEIIKETIENMEPKSNNNFQK